MEFNPVQSAPLSEKVLKEKRKKLRDTLNRIMRLYEKEEPTQWSQIKSMEVQYEKRRAERKEPFKTARNDTEEEKRKERKELLKQEARNDIEEHLKPRH